MIERIKQIVSDLDSMEFVHPFVLLFLIVPVTIVFWEWIRKGHPLIVILSKKWHRFYLIVKQTID